MQPRWAMSLMRGPMTRTEIRRALGQGQERDVAKATTLSPASVRLPGPA
jgi:hypothetical protein